MQDAAGFINEVLQSIICESFCKYAKETFLEISRAACVFMTDNDSFNFEEIISATSICETLFGKTF